MYGGTITSAHIHIELSNKHNIFFIFCWRVSELNNLVSMAVMVGAVLVDAMQVMRGNSDVNEEVKT